MDEKSGRKTLVSKAKSKTSWSWSDKLAIALACLAAILDLILHWVEKTPVLAAITVVAMVSLIVFPVIIFPHWKLRIPVLIVACALIGLFGWQIWPRKEAALSFTSTMEKAQQSSVLSKPVENPYQHTAAPTTSRQLRTPSVAKQQDCQSGSICNQDSLVDAPQTVIDRSQSAVRITVARFRGSLLMELL